MTNIQTGSSGATAERLPIFSTVRWLGEGVAALANAKGSGPAILLLAFLDGVADSSTRFSNPIYLAAVATTVYAFLGWGRFFSVDRRWTLGERLRLFPLKRLAPASLPIVIAALLIGCLEPFIPRDFLGWLPLLCLVIICAEGAAPFFSIHAACRDTDVSTIYETCEFVTHGVHKTTFYLHGACTAILSCIAMSVYLTVSRELGTLAILACIIVINAANVAAFRDIVGVAPAK